MWGQELIEQPSYFMRIFKRYWQVSGNNRYIYFYSTLYFSYFSTKSVARHVGWGGGVVFPRPPAPISVGDIFPCLYHVYVQGVCCTENHSKILARAVGQKVPKINLAPPPLPGEILAVWPNFDNFFLSPDPVLCSTIQVCQCRQNIYFYILFWTVPENNVRSTINISVYFTY